MSLVFHVVPMWRLTLRMVRSTLVTAWFLADWPTRTSPFLAKATTEGVVREPSELAMTVGSPPSRTATTEFVVPRSIPTARAMEGLSCALLTGWCWSGRRASGGRRDRLAPGALNFPAQPNGSPRPGVPGGARRVPAGVWPDSRGGWVLPASSLWPPGYRPVGWAKTPAQALER